MSASRAAYEAVQKKTFTNWANVHLKRKGTSMLIEDLYTDLADGTRLCSLYEVLTGSTIKHRARKKIKKKTHKLHSCENINQAIHFVEAQGITLVNMDASFIYEGRSNIILGLMWTSILNFQVADIDMDGLTGKRGLLEWAKRACKAQGVKVSNFTTSWKDGRALCALIANFRGDLLTMDQVGPKSEAMDNTNKALTIGLEQLDIAIVMDAEDLCVAKPDEKSVVTMVAEWFKAFAGQMKSAAYLRAVVNAVNLTRAHDDMRAQYEEKVAENSAWAAERTEAAETRAHGGSTAEVKDNLDTFYAYKGSDKVKRNADLQHTENILLALRTSQQNGGRPAYAAPSDELDIDNLKATFEALDNSEDKYAQSMLSTLKRFAKMDRSLDSIVMRAQKLKRWMDQAEEHFASVGSVDSIAACEAALAAHSAYGIECDAAVRALTGMEELSDTLSSDYTASTIANEAVAESKEQMDRVNDASKAYRAALEAQLLTEKSIVAEQAKYARLADDFLYVLDGVDSDANAPVFDTTSIPAIKERLDVIVELLGPGGRISDLEEKHSSEIEPCFDKLNANERANAYLPRHHKDSMAKELKDVKTRAKARKIELEDALNRTTAAAEGLFADSTREYNDVAKALKGWIGDSVKTFSDLNHGSTTDDTGAKLAEFEAWDAVKPEKRAKLDNLQFILNKVNESQRHNKLPELVPGVGHDPDSMKQQWKEMEKAGAEYKESLTEADINFNQWQRDADLFATKADKLEPWLDESLATFEKGDLGDSVAAVETLLANHEFYNRKLDRTQKEIDAMEKLAAGLEAPFHEADEAAARMQALKDRLAEMERMGKEYQDALAAQLAKEQKLKDLTKQYADEAEQLIFDIETCGDTVDEPLVADSIPLLNAKNETMTSLIGNDLPALATKMEAIQGLADEMEGFGRPMDELWLDRHAVDKLRAAHDANRLAAEARAAELAELLKVQRDEVERIQAKGIDAYKSNVGDFHEWVDASLEKFSSDSLADVIKAADVDGDGDLSFSEFQAAMAETTLELRSEFGTNSAETKVKLDDITAWENKEKPPRYVELEGLSTTLAKVNATLRLHEMDAFAPAADETPAKAQAAWKNLELQTSAYKLAVQHQHLEFLKMDHAAASFNEKSTKLNAWADAKLSAFGQPLALPSNARADVDSDDDEEPTEFVWKWEDGGHDSGVTGSDEQKFVTYDEDTTEVLEEAYNDGETECTFSANGKDYTVDNLQGRGDGQRWQVADSSGYKRAVARVPAPASDTFRSRSGSMRPSSMAITKPKRGGRRSSLAQLAAHGDNSLGKAKNVVPGGGMRRSSVMPIRDTTSIKKVKMDVAEIESKLGGLRTYKMQLGRFKHMCDDMEGIAEEIKAPYASADETHENLASSQEKLAAVESAAETFESALQEKLAEEQALLAKGREFDTAAAGFLGELESTMSEVNAPVIEDTAEVQAQLAVVSEIVEERIPTILERMPALNVKFLELANTPDRTDLWQETHHIDKLNSASSDMQDRAEERKAELEDMLEDEIAKDRLREEFAEKANEMVQFVADTLNAAKNFARGENLDGLDFDDEEEGDDELAAFPEKEEVKDLQKRIGAITQLLKPLIEEQEEELEALKEIDSRCAESNAQDNPHIDENMTSIQLRWDELAKTIEDVEGSLQSQIEAWNDAGLSDDQKKEIAKLFREFGGGDEVAEGEHRLDADGFFDAATAMGIPLDSKEQAAKDFAKYCGGDAMDLPTFVKYIEDNITASATKQDVLKCFQDLAGDPKYITEAEIAKSFTSHGFELVQYIVANMEEEEGKLNYKKFTGEIFKR